MLLMGKWVKAMKHAISYFALTILDFAKFLLGLNIDRNRKEGWIESVLQSCKIYVALRRSN